MKIKKEMEKKLGEAEYFFSQMKETRIDRTIFEYNLSAFINAARSVIQYPYGIVTPDETYHPKEYAIKKAQRDATGMTPEDKWFEDFRLDPKRRALFKFFKEERDLNIHEVPVKVDPSMLFVEVKPKRNSKTSGPESEERVVASLEPYFGKAIRQPKFGTYTPDIVFITYVFNKWKGNEDVFTLCRKYLDELTIMFKEGVSKGYITD